MFIPSCVDLLRISIILFSYLSLVFFFTIIFFIWVLFLYRYPFACCCFYCAHTFLLPSFIFLRDGRIDGLVESWLPFNSYSRLLILSLRRLISVWKMLVTGKTSTYSLTTWRNSRSNTFNFCINICCVDYVADAVGDLPFPPLSSLPSFLIHTAGHGMKRTFSLTSFPFSSLLFLPFPALPCLPLPCLSLPFLCP